MADTREIIKKIADLYSFGTEKKTSEEVAQQNFAKLMEKEKEWEKAFSDYETDDVILAINNFWRFKSDKTRPNVSQLLSLLQTEHDVKKKTQKKVDNNRYFNIEFDLMNRDVKNKRNQNYFLPDYRRAVKFILNDLLIEKIGASSFQKLSSDNKVWEVSEKYKIAMKNGLFNDFDEVLKRVNPPRYNEIGNVSDLEKIWSVNY